MITHDLPGRVRKERVCNRLGLGLGESGNAPNVE
jgi:hypothetical protein